MKSQRHLYRRLRLHYPSYVIVQVMTMSVNLDDENDQKNFVRKSQTIDSHDRMRASHT